MQSEQEQQCKKSNIRFFQLVTGALLLFYLPLLLSHPYFRDDWSRATDEIASFRAMGRVFAGYFLHFLTSDYQNLTETTPLFQFASIVVIIVCVCFALKIRKIPYTPLTATAVIAFLFNPFFIECILYRYDSLTMSIALMSALLGWAFLPKKPIIAALLLILSLGTYQPFVNLFILLGVAEFAFNLVNGKSIKESIYTLLRLCIIYCIAFAVYRLAIIPAYSVKTGRSSLIPFDHDGWLIVLRKIVTTIRIYPGFLSLTGKIIYGVGILLALCGIIATCLKKAKDKHILRIIIVLAALLILFPLSYGPFLFLSDTVIGPRILAPMIVFSAITIFFAMGFLLSNTRKWPAYVFATLFLLCPLSFCYMTNNALVNQDNFEDFINKDAASQILHKFSGKETVFIDGTLPAAPLVAGGIKRYSGMAQIVIPAQPWVSQLRLKSLGVQNVIFEWRPKKTIEIKNKICRDHIAPAVQSRYYALYPVENNLFVWLGDDVTCPETTP